MRDNDAFIGQVEDYLVEFDGATPLPVRVRDAIHAELPRTRQGKASPGFMTMAPMRSALWSRVPGESATLAWLGVTAVAIAIIGVVGLAMLRPPSVGPAAALGIFEPVADRIVYGSEQRIYGIGDGIWGIDPAASDPASTVQLTSEPGTPLGWSSDGTRLLIQRGQDTLLVLHADGSETLVTEQPWGLKGATISPDGSRVAFGGLTQPESEYGGLFAVDADGGPAKLLWEWPEPTSSLIVRFPTFSPDGTRIAFVVDNIDTRHSVWVINADGSDAHQIWKAEGFGPGHVRGLAWSPAGDRLALALANFGRADGIYTLAPDGADLTRVITTGDHPPFWSPDGSRIAYDLGCNSWDADDLGHGCVWAIAGADGSDVQRLSYGMAGPWHPGRPSTPVEPTAAPASSPTLAASPPASPSAAASGGMWPQTSLEEVRQAQALADAGDPDYTWQTDADLGSPGHLGQHHPHDAEIFTRFMTEVLGWEAFRDGHHMPRPDKVSLANGDVVYIRCAPGGTNPLYPNGPDGGCAPTLDELRYETVKINVAQLDRQGARGIWVVTGWEMVGPAEQAAPPTDAEIAASIGAFLQARIEGQGAERFIDAAASEPDTVFRVDQEALLLYATRTGARYERSEFELADGPVWPSGLMKFEVRLFADGGKTVVEQAYILERDEQGRLRIGYGGEGDGPGTTENGKAVPVTYDFLDGEVTYRAAHPLAPSYAEGLGSNGLAIEGLLPDDDAPRRVLLMLADPRPVGPDCLEAAAPTDAEALAGSIQADADFMPSAPVAVTIGGVPALQMDVVLAPEALPCAWSGADTGGFGPMLLQHAPFGRVVVGRGTTEAYGPDRARLWLIDLPEGSAVRVLALATVTDEDSFKTVLKWATPVVDSIEFHASR